MNIFKRELKNTNANIFKRSFCFTLDLMFANVLRVLFIKIYLLFTQDTIIRFWQNYFKFFKDTNITAMKDYQIRYIVRDVAFEKMFFLVLIILFSGIVYNFLCYLLFKNRTIGQMITKLEVLNNNEEKPQLNIFQKLFRSILAPLPYIIIAGLFFFSALNMLNFHQYMQRGDIIRNISFYLIKYSNAYTLCYIVILMFFIWLDIYFLTNRFLLHDILTHTRFADKKLYNKELKENFDGFVSIVDKTTNIIKMIFQKVKSIIKREK